MFRRTVMGLVPSILAVVVLAGVGVPLKVAHASEIEQKCAKNFPNWHEYFEKRKCIAELENVLRLRELKKNAEVQAKLREEKARTCIAKDLARMESLARKAKDSVKENMTIEQAKVALDSVLSKKSQIEPTEQNIKEWVAITRIPTKCDSKFSFLVNVTTLESGQLKRFGIWAKHAPKGYKGGYKYEFGNNFDATRKERAKLLRLEKSKRLEAESKKKRKAAADKKRAATSKKRKPRVRPLRTDGVVRTYAAHCAPHLSLRKRIKALSKYGTVLETEPGKVYKAGKHGMKYPYIYQPSFAGQPAHCF